MSFGELTSKKTGPKRYAFMIYAKLVAGVLEMGRSGDYVSGLSEKDWKTIYNDFSKLSEDHVDQGIQELPAEQDDIIVDYSFIAGRKPRFDEALMVPVQNFAGPLKMREGAPQDTEDCCDAARAVS